MPRISTCRSARWRLVGGPQSLAWCMSRRCFEGMLAIILKSGRTSWRFGKRTSSCPCGKPRRQSSWASLESKKKPKDQNPRDPHSPQNDSNREHWNHQADLAPLATLSAFLDIPSCLKNLPQSRVWEWNSHWQKPQDLEFGRRVGEEPYLHGSLLWKNHESLCRHLSSHAPLKMATQKCIMGVELPEAERTLDLEGLHKMAINTHKHTNTQHTHTHTHTLPKPLVWKMMHLQKGLLVPLHLQVALAGLELHWLGCTTSGCWEKLVQKKSESDSLWLWPSQGPHGHPYGLEAILISLIQSQLMLSEQLWCCFVELCTSLLSACHKNISGILGAPLKFLH